MRLVAFILSLLTLPAMAEEDLGDMLKSQIVPCWNVGGLADIKDYIWMFVSLDLKPDGTFGVDDLKWQENRGGTEDDALLMYFSIQRAVLTCGRDGFDLPADRYDEWRNSNLVFILNEEPAQ